MPEPRPPQGTYRVAVSAAFPAWHGTPRGASWNGRAPSLQADAARRTGPGRKAKYPTGFAGHPPRWIIPGQPRGTVGPRDGSMPNDEAAYPPHGTIMRVRETRRLPHPAASAT